MATLNQIITRKFIFTFSVFLICSTGIFAQSKEVHPGTELDKLNYLNAKQGLPPYTGIYVQYTLTVDQLKYANENLSQFTSDLKSIPDIIDCVVDVTNLKVIAKFPKKDKGDNPVYLANLKAKLDLLGVRMTNSKEILIKD